MDLENRVVWTSVLIPDTTKLHSSSSNMHYEHVLEKLVGTIVLRSFASTMVADNFLHLSVHGKIETSGSLVVPSHERYRSYYRGNVTRGQAICVCLGDVTMFSFAFTGKLLN